MAEFSPNGRNSANFFGNGMMTKLPPTSGTYVLLLYLRKGTDISVGRLGRIHFRRGWYAYVGSAFGPGGLAARLGRHLLEKKKLRWHIDYLRTVAVPRQIYVNTSAKKKLEHKYAAFLKRCNGMPIPDFGCSDCRCSSHLYYYKSYPRQLRQIVENSVEVMSLSVKNRSVPYNFEA